MHRRSNLGLRVSSPRFFLVGQDCFPVTVTRLRPFLLFRPFTWCWAPFVLFLVSICPLGWSRNRPQRSDKETKYRLPFLVLPRSTALSVFCLVFSVLAQDRSCRYVIRNGLPCYVFGNWCSRDVSYVRIGGCAQLTYDLQANGNFTLSAFRIFHFVLWIISNTRNTPFQYRC